MLPFNNNFPKPSTSTQSHAAVRRAMIEESRFLSSQRFILQTLDPIHLSLLINNSEFERINDNETTPRNQSTTTTCKLVEPPPQQQQPMQQEKRRPKNLNDSKQFDEGSFSTKSDATCVGASDCLMSSHEQCNIPNESQRTVTSKDTKKNLKNAQVRIVAAKKKSGEIIQLECVSPISPTGESSTCSDSEWDSPNSAVNRRTFISCSSTNSEDLSDRNSLQQSSSDETTTTQSNAPMIQIIQEVKEQGTVVSTVNINKKKVQRFQQNNAEGVNVSSKGKPQWKNTQQIIDDNVCNEILDENTESDVEGEETEIQNIPPIPDTIIYGKLKAKQEVSQGKKGGKLMKKRMSRIRKENRSYLPNFSLQGPTTKVSPSKAKRKSTVAPAKPPRTFASSSSKTSLDSIDGNTATTLPVEDDKNSSASQTPPQMSQGCHLVYTEMPPTCPSLDDINDVEKMKKIGWVESVPQHQECFHGLNMLNDSNPNPMSSKMTSANLTPEPQFGIPSKEDIDQVDSTLSPKPTPRRQKQCTSMDDSKRDNTPVRHLSDESSNQSELDISNEIKPQKMKPTGVRQSFGKGAIKKTKKLFTASKNIWNKPKPMKLVKQNENYDENESYKEHDLDVNNETPRKFRLNTTADFNTNNAPSIQKKTEKTLDLTPKQSQNTNNAENSRTIFGKFLTSVKPTPPKKPVRQSLVHKDVTRSPSNNEEDFNFNRVVDSPKSKEKGFKLSPKKLFFTNIEKPNGVLDNSYRSFDGEQRDGLKECIVEYLRNMHEHIEQKPEESRATISPSRVRDTCSNPIDYIPPRERTVQIDCHPEPDYEEILTQPPASSLNHIIVNNDPKAIYALVNKTKSEKPPIPPKSVGVAHDNRKRDAIYKSDDSLSQYVDHNLIDSVMNFMDLLKVENLDEQNQRGDSLISDESPELELEGLLLEADASKQNEEASDDSTSIDTIYLENLLDNVNRGDSVNNEIVSMIENMEHDTSISLVESDADDDDLHRTYIIDENAANKCDSTDDVDYCSIVEQDVTDGPITVASTSKTSDVVRSSLTSAPSMIEIPDHFMQKLTNQIAAQREVRNQLKRAIKVCRTTKEFECSSELIEAERLLLISTIKENCAKLELNRIDYEQNGLTTSPSKCVGTMTIKKIEFDLKRQDVLEQICQLTYICICSYRDQVVATQTGERHGGKVKFDDIAIKIEGLNSAFEIKLEVYMLRLPRQIKKYSHESKYHLNKVGKKPMLFNAVKLFSNSSVTDERPTYDLEESRYRLRGVATISVDDLSSEKFEIVRNHSWPIDHVYISYNNKSLDFKISDRITNMTGALRAEFVCELNQNDSGLMGLLYIDEDKENSSLQERWCRLNGCTIEVWKNYSEYTNGDRPIFSIDLITCNNELFKLMENRIAVDIFNVDALVRNEEYRIHRYWISAKNGNDLILWLTDLNRILKFIKEWKM